VCVCVCACVRACVCCYVADVTHIASKLLLLPVAANESYHQSNDVLDRIILSVEAEQQRTVKENRKFRTIKHVFSGRARL
jgi:hypothetical protein